MKSFFNSGDKLPYFTVRLFVCFIFFFLLMMFHSYFIKYLMNFNELTINLDLVSVFLILYLVSGNIIYKIKIKYFFLIELID